MKQIRKVFAATTKAADEERALIVTISTPTPDRSGDIVEPHGVDLTNYKRNPVVLFGHDYNDLPIAKADDLQVTDEGIVARVVFPEKGTYHKADAVYGLAKQGMINAWSIGFAAKQADTEPLEEGGLRFTKSELLEFSAVPVPANPEALTILRSKSIEDEVIDEVTAEGPKEEEELEDSKPEEEQEKSVETDVVEKESRVLSGTTRKEIGDALTQMKTAMAALEALMSASETTKEEEPANEEEKSSTHQDHHMVLTYEQALKAADKVIGVALRDAKRPKQAS